mmetsp:Transcript_3546/g.8910  ORF Transcript_3546/g.8910 Transcript_3546/m.8910 type:complete len:209 (+) Transcript_3546:492-1118(+)
MGSSARRRARASAQWECPTSAPPQSQKNPAPPKDTRTGLKKAKRTRRPRRRRRGRAKMLAPKCPRTVQTSSANSRGRNPSENVRMCEEIPDSPVQSPECPQVRHGTPGRGVSPAPSTPPPEGTAVEAVGVVEGARIVVRVRGVRTWFWSTATTPAAQKPSRPRPTSSPRGRRESLGPSRGRCMGARWVPEARVPHWAGVRPLAAGGPC